MQKEIEQKLQEKEKALAEESYSTAAELKTVAFYIQFPQPLAGQRILDIGGGVSTAVLELRRLGARAYAVDFRYRDLDELKKSVENFLTDPALPSRQKYQEEFEKTMKELEQNIPHEVDSNLWQLAGQMTRRYREKGNELYHATQRKQLELFLDLKSEKPYVGGSAAFLPFRDRSFNFCYSLQTISQFLVDDREVLIQSVVEALRVLKPRGQLQLHPWVPNPKDASDPKIGRNTAALLQYLEQRRIPYRVEKITLFNQPRLVVYKRK